MSIPLFVIHNVHVYVGIPSYLRETFEAHKVGLSLSPSLYVSVIMMGGCRSCTVAVEYISTDETSTLILARRR